MGYKITVQDDVTIFDSKLQAELTTMVDPILKISAHDAGSLTFTILPGHRLYDVIDTFCLTRHMTVFRDGVTAPIFSGRVYRTIHHDTGAIDVEVEGAFSVLADTLYAPGEFSGTTTELFESILNSHNIQSLFQDNKIFRGTVTVTSSQIYRKFTNYETSSVRLQALRDQFGGYMMIRKASNGYYLDWVRDFSLLNSPLIEVGKNLISARVQKSYDDVITRIIPLGAVQEDGTRLTIASVNSGQVYLQAPESRVTQYGYITQAINWPDINNASTLKTRGQAYLDEHGAATLTIQVKCVDLRLAGEPVSPFLVGNKARVTIPALNLSEQPFNLTEQTLHLLRPASDTLTLETVVYR